MMRPAPEPRSIVSAALARHPVRGSPSANITKPDSWSPTECGSGGCIRARCQDGPPVSRSHRWTRATPKTRRKEDLSSSAKTVWLTGYPGPRPRFRPDRLAALFVGEERGRSDHVDLYVSERLLQEPAEPVGRVPEVVEVASPVERPE